jgi:hypothetical protein
MLQTRGKVAENVQKTSGNVLAIVRQMSRYRRGKIAVIVAVIVAANTRLLTSIMSPKIRSKMPGKNHGRRSLNIRGNHMAKSW